MRSSQYTTFFPYTPTLVTNIDPIVVSPENAIQLDNVILTTTSVRKRPGQARFNTAALGTTGALVYGIDYWATVSNVKRPAAVVCRANASSSVAGSVYRSISWVASSLANFNTIALRIDHGGVTACVFNNDLVMGFKNNGTACLRVWNDQQSTGTLQIMTASSGTLPSRGWIVQEFARRLFVAGDPTQPDVLTFSAIGDRTAWAGVGDGKGSSIVIGTENDKDPQGITAIIPGLRGEAGFYVAKRNSIYRIDTSALNPDLWRVNLLSEGIGVINPNAWCTVDQQDIFFISDRGAHFMSQILAGTQYSEGSFLSAPIHDQFQTVIDPAFKDRISCSWYAPLNSILVSTKIVGRESMDVVYLYNIDTNPRNGAPLAWYRWTSVPCNFLWTRFNATSQMIELYGVGARNNLSSTDRGFINKLNQSNRWDFSSSTAIVTTVTTPNIYPQPVLMEKAFLGIGFIYRGRDNSTFNCQYSIDSQTIDTLTYQQVLLGNFILGSSTLGVASLGQIPLGVKPNIQHSKGVGHQVQLQITQTDAGKDLEILGIIIETTDAGESTNAFRKINV